MKAKHLFAGIAAAGTIATGGTIATDHAINPYDTVGTTLQTTKTSPAFPKYESYVAFG